MNVLKLSPSEGAYPLSCAAVDREAVRYCFNGVSDQLRRALQMHLSRCPRCRMKLRLFQLIWMLDGEKRRQDRALLPER